MTTSGIWQSQVFFGDKAPAIIHPGDWRPWLDSAKESQDMMQGLALNQALRNRGGLRYGERLVAWIYLVEPTTPCHDNGTPMACQMVQLVLTQESPRVGPVPAYDRAVDGDYMSFLARNNCD